MQNIFKNKRIVISLCIGLAVVLIIASVAVAIILHNKSSNPDASESQTSSLGGQSQQSFYNAENDSSVDSHQSQTNPNSSAPNNSSSAISSTAQNTNSSSSTDSSTTASQNNSSFLSKRPEKNIVTYPIRNEFSAPSYQTKIFKDSKSGKELKYCLYLPDDYSSAKKYPVLLFMHGMGSIGNDYLSATNGLKPVFENSGDIVKSAIIIAPQSPDAGGFWPIHNSSNDECGWGGIAMRLLLDIEKNYSCDTNRIYVTGNSMGGHGTWNLIETYSDHFAAAIPICGWGNTSKANKLVNLPIWIYHGDADPTVPVTSSRAMYNAIKNAGSTKIHYTELPGVQHDSWTAAYQNRELISWMFSQNKATNKTGDYEIIPFLKVYDDKNNLIISEKDTSLISYMSIENTDCLELKLTDNGAKKLETAYKNSNGKTFTVYFGNIKIMTFTATKGSVDKVFYIPDAFSSYDYYEYVSKMDSYK